MELEQLFEPVFWDSGEKIPAGPPALTTITTQTLWMRFGSNDAVRPLGPDNGALTALESDNGALGSYFFTRKNLVNTRFWF